jgi:hypothetical protein
MSSNLMGSCRFIACPILRIEDDDMSFSALSSEARLAPGASGLVPANTAGQVSKGKTHVKLNSPMSSKLTGHCRCATVSVFRGEGVGVSSDASSSEAEVSLELNGSVPTAIEQQVNR